MDDDPWADTPATPRTGTARISLDNPAGTTGAAEAIEKKKGASGDIVEDTINGPVQVALPSSPLAEQYGDTDAPQDQAGVQTEDEDVDDELATTTSPSHEPGSTEGDDFASHEDPAPLTQDDGFDDFDDFDELEAGPSTTSANGFSSSAGGRAGDDDGFGDFGDFEEGDFEDSAAGAAVPAMVVESPTQAGPSWRALNLRPFPTTSEMLDQLSDILRPLVPPAGVMSDEPVRSVGGLGQVMVAESSRDVYAQLTTAPMLKPLDWTRSRVRREHLISMGVPVNLDEVDSHRLSALPPLRITTEQGQAQAQARRAQSLDVRSNGNASAGGDRPASALSQRDKGKGRQDTGGGSGKYGLGDKPAMDVPKAEELCGIEEDRLGLLPLATLRQIQDQLVATSAQASASLAWSLQLKDAQSQDSATYNGMISELISNAAKAKSAQQAGSGGVFRRSSQKVPARTSTSASGTSTPRVASPAMR